MRLATIALLALLVSPAPAQFASGLGGAGGDSDSVGSLPVKDGVIDARERFRRALANGEDPGRSVQVFRFEMRLAFGETLDAPQTWGEWWAVRSMFEGLASCNVPEWPPCAGVIPFPCLGPTEWNYCRDLAKCLTDFDADTWPGMPQNAYDFAVQKMYQCLRDAEADFTAAAKACACPSNSGTGPYQPPLFD